MKSWSSIGQKLRLQTHWHIVQVIIDLAVHVKGISSLEQKLQLKTKRYLGSKCYHYDKSRNIKMQKL